MSLSCVGPRRRQGILQSLEKTQHLMVESKCKPWGKRRAGADGQTTAQGRNLPRRTGDNSQRGSSYRTQKPGSPLPVFFLFHHHLILPSPSLLASPLCLCVSVCLSFSVYLCSLSLSLSADVCLPLLSLSQSNKTFHGPLVHDQGSKMPNTHGFQRPA